MRSRGQSCLRRCCTERKSRHGPRHGHPGHHRQRSRRRPALHGDHRRLALRRGRHRLPPVPRLQVPRRVRRLGGDLRGPLRRSPCTDPLPQLGLGASPRRARGRRDRRGGALPEHRPAVLRGGQPGRAATGSRRLRASLRRCAGSQPLARRLLRRRARAAGGCGAGVRQPARGRARRDPLGGRTRRPPGRCVAALGAAQLRSPRAVRSSLRPALAALRGARPGDQHPLGDRAPRLRGARARPGDHAGRAPLVRPPPALAPHLRRRLRAVPQPEGGPHRTGRRVAPSRARDPRLVLRAHGRGRCRRSASSSARPPAACR